MRALTIPDEAIVEGGRRRLKSIVMTTLMTLLRFFTVLFTGRLGSELQRPLALSLISGLIVGTLISLFYIPVFYWFLYRKSKVRYSQVLNLPVYD